MSFKEAFSRKLQRSWSGTSRASSTSNATLHSQPSMTSMGSMTSTTSSTANAAEFFSQINSMTEENSHTDTSSAASPVSSPRSPVASKTNSIRRTTSPRRLRLLDSIRGRGLFRKSSSKSTLLKKQTLPLNSLNQRVHARGESGDGQDHFVAWCQGTLI